VADCLIPGTWVKQDRIKLERRLGMENIKKHVEEDTWVLEKLAIHPRYQREGDGTALLKWGTEQAQAEGKKIFLRSSYVGLPFTSSPGSKKSGIILSEEMKKTSEYRVCYGVQLAIEGGLENSV